MPRGVRKIIDFDEQLKVIDKKMAALTAERQDVINKKREGDLKTLSEFMTEKGLLPEDVIDMLSPAVAASAQKNSSEV